MEQDRATSRGPDQPYEIQKLYHILYHYVKTLRLISALQMPDVHAPEDSG